MDKEEIRNLAKELVELTLEVKDRNKKIKELRDLRKSFNKRSR